MVKVIRPGGPGFVDIYHLTNKKGYDSIMKSGWIIPLSHPFWRSRLDKGNQKYYLEKAGADFLKIKAAMPSDKYVVGFNRAIPAGWIKSGLMNYVLRHIQSKSSLIESRIGREVYSFKLDVSLSHLFVRDHWYTSPAFFIKKYRYDYWSKYMAQCKVPQIADGIAKYLNSSVSYGNYLKIGRKYIAPEMWYAGSFKLNNVTGIKKLSSKGIEVLKG